MPKDRIVPYSNQSGPVRTRRIAPGFAGESSSADRRAAKRAVSGSQGDGRNGAVGRTRANAHSAADERTLLVDGIEVRLSRKRVKNLNLRISRDGSHVDVSASSWVSEDEVCDFVRRKAAWIESHLAQAADTPMARASQAKPEEVAQWREVVSACVPALIAAWEPIMGVRAGKLAYRNMTSRWGSCQPATAASASTCGWHFIRRNAWNMWSSTSCVTCWSAATVQGSTSSWTRLCPIGKLVARSCARGWRRCRAGFALPLACRVGLALALGCLRSYAPALGCRASRATP